MTGMKTTICFVTASMFILLWVDVMKDAKACEEMQFVSRAEWGARNPKTTANMTTPVPHIFIHHTATRECPDFNSCKRLMQSIQNYHMDDKGWDDIGYNFVIGGDGKVYEGRGWNRVGAHTYGYNRVSVAFCLIGDFTSKIPSQAMLNTTRNLIQCARNENHVTENYKLHGHRDVGNTECPGTELYGIIKSWPNFQGGPLT